MMSIDDLQQLVKHIRQTLPPTSDAIANDLVAECGLSLKDALTLAVLNDGQRLEYFDEVCEAWIQLRDHNASIEPRKGNESTPGEEGPHDPEPLEKDLARIAGNWYIPCFKLKPARSTKHFHIGLFTK